MSDTDNSSTEEKNIEQFKKEKTERRRPTTATSKQKSGENQETDKLDNDTANTNNKTEENSDSKFNKPSTSYETMLHVDPYEARQSIIDTFNSYEDDRFPSQGINYSDMDENARIDQSVASEILDRTLKYEEQEMYRHYDVINSHAGRIDNKTNAIIEQISDQLTNEYTLPEVSRILEAHMEAVEQRWRDGGFVHFVPASPPESVVDENEATLIPSHDTSLEDTLTEDNVKDKMEAIAENNVSCENENDKDANKDNCNEEDSDIINNESEINYVNITDNNKDCNSSKDEKSIAEQGVGKVDTMIEYYESLNNFNDNVEALTSITESEVFEDCVDNSNDLKDNTEIDAKDDGNEDFDRIAENFTLEMKLALGIVDKNA